MCEADTMMQVQMPKFTKKLAQILSVYTKKIAGGQGSAPDPIVTAVVSIFKHCWRTTGSWKNVFGVLEKFGNFGNQESGNPGDGLTGARK